MIVETNFINVLNDLESEYETGLSLTITIFALEEWQSFFLTLELKTLEKKYFPWKEKIISINLLFKINN
jgi:hypothetical protein